MEFADSADKHGIPRDDALHAIAHPIHSEPQGPRSEFIIGPARNGALLEIVVLDPDDDPAVVHAMQLRPKYFNRLRR